MHSTQLVPRLLIRSYSKSWYGFAEPFWTVREKAYEFGLWTEGVAVVFCIGLDAQDTNGLNVRMCARQHKRERWLEGTDGVHLPISKALLRGSVHPIGVLEFTKRKWMGGLSH